MIGQKGNFEENIKTNLKILYEVVENKLEEYLKKALRGTTEGGIKKYRELKEKFEIIKEYKDLDDDGEEIYDLVVLNIKSFQCILLLTDLVLTTVTPNVKNHLRSTNLGIVPDYDFFIKSKWHDFNVLFKKIEEYERIYTSPGFTYKPLIHTSDQNNDSICPDLSGSYIIVILGKMKLIDLIKSMANQVYFIGLTTDIEYADGIMMTPFDFMRHDIIHSSRVLQDLDYFRPDLSYVKEFIEHIDNNNKYNQKKLQTALFLLMHETFGGYHYLSRPIINFFNKGKKLSFLKEILFQDISNISKWRDTTYFGLILPKNIRENKEDTVIVE